MAHLCHFLTAGQHLSTVGQYSGIASASLHAVKEMQVSYHQSVGGNELGKKPNFFKIMYYLLKASIAYV